MRTIYSFMNNEDIRTTTNCMIIFIKIMTSKIVHSKLIELNITITISQSTQKLFHKSKFKALQFIIFVCVFFQFSMN